MTPKNKPYKTPRMDSVPFDPKRGSLKKNQSIPIVDHVLVIGDRAHPYKLPTIQKAWVNYHTYQMVSFEVNGETRRSYSDKVYCLSNEAQWNFIQAKHQKFQEQLNRLAQELLSMGEYKSQLEKLGGFKGCKQNPLCPFVVHAPDPNYEHSPSFELWEIYPHTPVAIAIEKHTPQMLNLKVTAESLQTITTQANMFCIQSEQAWLSFIGLHQKAKEAQEIFIKSLEALGTYEANLKRPKSEELRVGSKVKFMMDWDGHTSPRTGTITKFISPNIAEVMYTEPDSIINRKISIITDALQKLNPDRKQKQPPLNQTPEFNTAPETPTPESSTPEPKNKKWINTSRVPGTEFRQAYWESSTPIFPSVRYPGKLVRKQYIGKVGSPKHQAAIEELEDMRNGK